jgi:hypothetical protein
MTELKLLWAECIIGVMECLEITMGQLSGLKELQRAETLLRSTA